MPRPPKRGTQEPRSRAPGAHLTILDGRDARKEVPVLGGLTIGRTVDNGIVILDAGVSRKHAEIRLEGGIYTLADLGSANGTVLNDQKITGIEVLRTGDIIVVGATGMQFSAPEDSRPIVGDSTRLASIAEIDGQGAPDTDVGPGGRRKRRPVAGVLLGLLVVGILGGLAFGVRQLIEDGPTSEADLSGEVTEATESADFFDRTFGLGRSDQSHPSKASFSFNYLRGRVTIQYAASGIDVQGEVQIVVNDQVVGAVPTTGGAWKYGLYLELPRALLRPGPGNIVTFRQTRQDPWEIGYLRIRQDPLLPPNPQEADSQLQIARKLHEDRDVEPANRWNAMLKFRLAADLLELASPRPEAYTEATQMADRINAELNELFQRGRFSAEREYRFGNVEAAREFVLRTMAHFPDRRDVRYRELELYLQALDQE